MSIEENLRQRGRRWRKVRCDECEADGLELITASEWEAWLAEKWIWLCAECFCPGDEGDEEGPEDIGQH